MAALFLNDNNLATLRTLVSTETLRVEGELERWRQTLNAPSAHEDDLALWLHDVTQLAKAVTADDEE